MDGEQTDGLRGNQSFDAPSGVMVITYGEHKIVDFDQLPAASRLALAQRGFAHLMGNEVASSVTGWIKQQVRGANKGKEVTTEEVKAWRAANSDAVAEFAKAEADEAMGEILSGTMGTRSSGPRGPKLDEFAALCRDIAQDEVGDFLVKHQVLARNSAGDYVIPGSSRKPVSGGKSPDKLVTIGDESFTLAQLVDRRLAKAEHKGRIEGEANKRLEAKRRALGKVAMEGGLEDVL